MLRPLHMYFVYYLVINILVRLTDWLTEMSECLRWADGCDIIRCSCIFVQCTLYITHICWFGAEHQFHTVDIQSNEWILLSLIRFKDEKLNKKKLNNKQKTRFVCTMCNCDPSTTLCDRKKEQQQLPTHNGSTASDRMNLYSLITKMPERSKLELYTKYKSKHWN